MNKNFKRILCFALALLLVLSVLPAAFAASDSGKCGDKLTWTLNGTTLTISGKGDMYNYSSSKPAPWGTSITSITFKSGVTSIGKNAFLKCTALTNVNIPKNITKIGASAFSGCTGLELVKFRGRPATIGSKSFKNVTAKIYYAADAGWQKAARSNYGGKLKWVPFHTLYTVKYNANGGKNAPSSFVKADGETVRLSTDVPTRSGYEFLGWAATKTASSAKYKVGAKYKLDKSTTLYAVWAPKAPNVSIKLSSEGKPTLSWKTVKGAEKYQIWRSNSGEAGTFKLQTTITNKSFTDAKAANGKLLYYKVRAVSANGVKSAYSLVVSKTSRPAAPKVTVSYTDAGKPTLSWSSVNGSAKFQVLRSKTGADGSFSVIATCTTASYTDASVAAGSTHYYKVRAVAADDTKGTFSAVKKAVAGILAPTISVKLSANGKPVVSWGKVTGASKYEVYRSTTGKDSSFSLLSTVTACTLSDDGAAYGKTYYYKVRSVSAFDTKSSFSNVVSSKATTPAPAAPSLTISLTDDNHPKLSWKAVSGSVKYEIYRSTTGKDDSFSLIATLKDVIVYVDSDTDAGTTYYYKVRGITSDGVIGVFSKTISVETEAEHVHVWVPVYSIMHYEEQTEEQWIVDQEGVPAWDEYVVIAKHFTCECGKDFPTYQDYIDHSDSYLFTEESEDHSSYSYTPEYELVTHAEIPEVGHYETVVVAEAFDEEVLEYYECECGEKQTTAEHGTDP